MKNNSLLLTSLWILGLAAWLVATRDLARLPIDFAKLEASRSYIVQGPDSDAAARAVRAAGGVVTHELGIIRAVGARLTTAQRRQLEADDGVTRIYEDQEARVSAASGVNSMNLAPIQDSWLDETSPNLNLGSAAELTAGWTPGAEQRAILRFDLSPLPDEISVVSATLYAWVTEGGGHPIAIHRVIDPWSETGATWDSVAHALDPAPDATFTPAAGFATANLTSVAQAWLSGLLPEHGLMLLGTAEGQETRLASREWPAPGERPFLRIDYVDGVPGGAGGGDDHPGYWNAEDGFDDVSYAGDDGNVAWLGHWREIGEDDGPRRGKVRITAYGDQEQGLRIQHKQRGAVRPIDLSDKINAILTFDAQRVGFDGGDSDSDSDSGSDSDSNSDSDSDGGAVPHVEVKVSADGGDSWTLLGRIAGTGNDDQPQSYLFDLGDHLGANVKLRFVSSQSMKNRHQVYIDNVRISGDTEIHGAGQPADEAPPYSNYPELIGAAELHGQGLTGAGVTVAIVDTGLWPWQALLQDTSGESRPSVRYDALTDTVFQGADANGHGTHVASVTLSSAEPLGQPGTYNGVAPDAGLVSIKAFDQHGQGKYADIIRGLDWLLRHQDALDVRVLNLSFSAPLRSYYWDDPLNQAVMAAWEAGIVVVTSAGNDGPDPMTIGVPGNVPYVITVGGMTDAFTPTDRSDDHLSFYSAAGPTVEAFVKPELIAPGGHILGVLDPASLLALQHPERLAGSSFTMSGTSQASGVVSGAVALLLQAQPWLTPDEVKCRLMDSALTAVAGQSELVYSPFQQGAGLLNVAAATSSDELTCANVGLDVTADLDGVSHFAGPARWDEVNGYYVEGIGYDWDGGLATGGAAWLDATPWVEIMTDATPWVEGNPWLDATPWVEGASWLDASPWVDATHWVELAHLWTSGLTEMTSVNVWVDED